MDSGGAAKQSAGRGGVVLRRLIGAAACVAIAMATQAQAQCAGEDPSVAISVQATPITAFSLRAPDQRRFGVVEYLGGLELKSSHREFGGFSAIRVEPDGQRFVSLSDRGWWLSGRLVYDRGRPAGIADARMAPMLGPDGRTLKARGWYDTESLAERDGWLYVGIERVNRIVRFDFARCGFRASAVEYPSAATAASHPPYSNLPYNKGLEALTFAPRNNNRLSGALVAFSERGLDSHGNLRAFLVGAGPGTAMPAEFSVRRRDNFDISDSATLPSGNVLLLERRFSWWTGIAFRLRRIAISDIAAGALVDGADLLVADMGYEIDNMEGLSVHADANSAIVLTMVSDDNFNFLQRTLLLQFRLLED
jgi:hypothetical protein